MPRYKVVDRKYYEINDFLYEDVTYSNGEVKTTCLGVAELIYNGMDDDDDMEECCVACGNGAYPDCKASCSIFDD